MMKEEFLEYLRLERNYSQSTVDNYGRALRSLKDYFETLEEPLSWLTIDSDHCALLDRTTDGCGREPFHC